MRRSPLALIVLGLWVAVAPGIGEAAAAFTAPPAGRVRAASTTPTASAHVSAHAGAHAARAVRVREEGHLRFMGDNATTIIDTGRIHGTIPGVARVNFIYNGSPEVSATFTIHGPGGTIRGRARGRLSDPVNPAPSFRGNLSITGGSGRYASVRGSGELFGVFHRRGYALIFQAIGTLRY